MASARSTRRLTAAGWAAGAGAVVTLAVAAVPGLRFAYESLELHVALESSQGVIALLLSYLAFGRHRLTRRLPDLALGLAFAAFAAANLFVSALPIALEGETVAWTAWAAVGMRLLACATLAAASLAPDRQVQAQSLGIKVGGACGAALGVVILLAMVADVHLADLIDPELSPDDSRRPVIAGHALAVTLQVAAGVLMAVAAIAYAWRSLRTTDELAPWLAAGATMGTFARVNYILFPSLYTEWLYSGDVLRLGSYLFFLAGAAREIGSYWRRQADLAVMDERRRMARDLHDGLTQELAFIQSQVSSMAAGAGHQAMLPFVAEAAERALVESRKVIATLSGAGALQVVDAVRRAAEEVAERAGVTVEVVGEDLAASPQATEALERIVREAVTNAVRHGGATIVSVRIGSVDSRIALRATDNGGGFDVAAVRGAGFGLTSMRERAEGLGGVFRVESAPGAGTSVEAVVPAG